ncbi:Zinc finger C-x8-C-x5-C-x3-H type domain containing protein [Babesia bovis T2Bo]|uniref:Zinc finger C-x8-C-x5-C-x3-H type domain containing protein n=1 Tax=Babesia bovis TaxID=5865 RepID=A7AN16_BABBO|nr:Zinc finger C-x8-C-x5-C-x3-H type domain containing protein [Babesia bovis T2Bo]EDO07950.1 Zinc finger C-x8-C-x5-C-x3-H type domain containing protein [Babesia bovis T2Bo]|eukprot:XP_001611518.1 Zinc finger C-x8-C-x5-C-x3-H type domain containing protein [Babesia bovis T2Bo]
MSGTDVRSISLEQFHKTKLCPHMSKSVGCIRSKRAECPYAHSPLELKEPPNLLKTAMCKSHLKGICKKDASECPYAHSYAELRHTDGFYKTYLCKYWQNGYCKAGNMCRYAHGTEELRNKDELASMEHTNEGVVTSMGSTEKGEVRHRETTTPTVPMGYCFDRGSVYVYPCYSNVNPYCTTPSALETNTWINNRTKEQEEAYCLMHFYLQKYIECCSKQQRYENDYNPHTYANENNFND